MSNQTNPLSNHFRSPKLYIKLPSGTDLYSKDVIEFPDSGELPIFPMTAKDEILLKNPDALLNGEATVQLIKSCCPNVKQPLEVYAPDIDAILVAINGASNNDNIEVKAPCPDCEEESEITLSAEAILEMMGKLEKSYVVDIADNLQVELRPFTYRSTIKVGLASFQSSRSLQSLADLTDDLDKLKVFNENFMRIAGANFELLVDSVKSVTIKQDDEDIVVTDRKQILEFLENCESSVGKKIEESSTEINSIGINKEATFQCEKCDKTFESPVQFDPVNFFTAS